MKKIFAIVAALFVAVSAQAQYLAEGEEIASLGIGLGSRYEGMPVTLEYEYGLKTLDDNSSIGVGGLLSYSGKKIAEVLGDKWYGRYFTIGVNSTYHNSFDLVDNLDLFATVGLGYTIGKAVYKPSTGSKVKGSADEFFFGVNVGARYFFNENLAAYAKVGYSMAVFELGVSYKFNSGLFK
ncbi:MAG: outer membrane beta-barrel protein [Rikenellaceae bacterium]